MNTILIIIGLLAIAAGVGYVLIKREKSKILMVILFQM